MKSPLISIAALAVLGAAAAPAHADTFDGPYVGVTAGWERSEIADRIDAQPITREASRDALVLGGYAGYNLKATDRIVIGAEAGFSAAVDDQNRAASAGKSLTIDPRYSFDLSARAGYLVTDKALVYVRGGYANTRVRTSLDGLTGPVTASDNLDGWQVGGGLEYAISDRISARAEYRYSDLGSNGGQYDRHQTLVGVSYNF
ncbi:outer membrane protein [Porphyrobacter sp. ULC335]|uniref:outer membrane protein n=1 Tax=Porphyrobacter sp. ULC335 TaxID=2854260 RepID=UPI0022204B28|nr:outer membrane beta-barrel protein [Porphyrobacter sp. ULC335]UYV15410.1 outer membrane beta-barrel protein [Porphyrobacter sp. ULC335]